MGPTGVKGCDEWAFPPGDCQWPMTELFYSFQESYYFLYLQWLIRKHKSIFFNPGLVITMSRFFKVIWFDFGLLYSLFHNHHMALTSGHHLGNGLWHTRRRAITLKSTTQSHYLKQLWLLVQFWGENMYVSIHKKTPFASMVFVEWRLLMAWRLFGARLWDNLCLYECNLITARCKRQSPDDRAILSEASTKLYIRWRYSRESSVAVFP